MVAHDSAPGAPHEGSETGHRHDAVVFQHDRAPLPLRGLVARGVLTPDQLDAVLAALAEDRSPRPTAAKLLAEIAAYVGAALLLSGVGLLVVASWDDLARAGRVALFAVVAVGLAGTGVALAGRRHGSAIGHPVAVGVTGAMVVSRPHSARTRLAAVLFMLSSISTAAAVGSVVDSGSGDTAWVYACFAGLLVGIAGYLALPSLVGVLTVAGFSAAVVPGVMYELLDIDSPGTGIAVLGLGLVWFALTKLGAVTESWAGYLIAVVIAVYGAQLAGIAEESPAVYLLTALVALLCFGLYAAERSWVLILGGTAALALAAVEAVWDWTDGSIGAAAAVLVIGAGVLGIGSVLLARAPKSSELGR